VSNTQQPPPEDKKENATLRAYIVELKRENDLLKQSQQAQTESSEGLQTTGTERTSELVSLQHINAAAPIGLCSLDKDLRYVFVNEWLAALNGLSVEQHLGRTISEVLPDVAAGVEAQLRQVIETGIPIVGGAVVAETAAHPGAKKYFEYNYDAVRSADGTIVCVSCVVQDVTERKQAEEALRESEARFSRLADATFEGVVIHDKGIVIDANQAVADMFGIELSEVIGQDALQRWTSPEARENVLRHIRNGDEQPYETVASREDGSTFPVEICGKNITSGGTPLRVIGMRDITERKRAEEKLYEWVKLYRNAIAAADAVVYQKEYAGNTYSYMGAAITDLIGYDINEVTPDLWFKIVTQVEMHGSAKDKSQSELRRLFKNGELPVWQGDYKCTTKNGETRWLNDSSVPIHDEAGKVVGCLGVLQNITDRKLAEERLRQSEERFALALEATSECVWDWNIASGEMYFNPHWFRVLGFNPSEVEPSVRFWDSLVHPEDMPRIMEALNAHYQGKTEVYECEVRLRTKSGEYRWILDRGKVVARDKDGKPLRMVGVNVDITERKRTEESRLKLSRELDHRVKNNLASVIALAQLTAQSTDSIQDFVKLFTNRITSLARVHETLAKRRWRGIELEELMRVVMGPFHGCGQRLRLSGPEIIVSARKVQPLALVMHELLSNAARHGSLSTEDGIVEVKWQREAQRVVIDWSEHGGPPIANPQEFGVGLRLVSGFVEKEIGGNLEVDFNAKGFRCVIQLPVPLGGSSSGDET